MNKKIKLKQNRQNSDFFNYNYLKDSLKMFRKVDTIFTMEKLDFAYSKYINLLDTESQKFDDLHMKLSLIDKKLSFLKDLGIHYDLALVGGSVYDMFLDNV